jgi:hypothetical protein
MENILNVKSINRNKTFCVRLKSDNKPGSNSIGDSYKDRIVSQFIGLLNK